MEPDRRTHNDAADPVGAADEAAAGAAAAGGLAERSRTSRGGTETPRSGLLIDWGGVLTTNLFASFHAHCMRADIDPQKMLGVFRRDPAARELLIALETGELGEELFEIRFAELLEIEPEGLIDGLFAGVAPDLPMLEAVRRARAAGIRTALVSNSWGVHRYPHEMFDELFHGVVISGAEGMRKPARRMYELGAERAGVRVDECVFVDDLPFNLAPAEELGMAVVHHTSAQSTIPELERLLGIELDVLEASPGA